jgi:hypothetical protein
LDPFAVLTKHFFFFFYNKYTWVPGKSLAGLSDSDTPGTQTRIASMVFRRVGQSTLPYHVFNFVHYLSILSRTYFRPNKPLPTNVCFNQPHLPMTPRQPFKWAIIDFIVSCLFLGILYKFFERTRLSTGIADEESGLRYATPTTHVLIGAYTCLVVHTVPSPLCIFLYTFCNVLW